MLAAVAGAVAAACAAPLLIMPVGDSITMGSQAASQAGYRGPLYSELAAAGWNFQFVGATNIWPGTLPTTPVDQTYYNGYSGVPTSYILANISSWLAAEPADDVLLMIGTNDANQHVPLATAVSNMSAIIDAITAARPTANIYMAEVVPETYENCQSYISQYNADLVSLAAVKEAAGDRIRLVDMYTNFYSSGGSLVRRDSPERDRLRLDGPAMVQRPDRSADVPDVERTGAATPTGAAAPTGRTGRAPDRRERATLRRLAANHELERLDRRHGDQRAHFQFHRRHVQPQRQRHRSGKGHRQQLAQRADDQFAADAAGQRADRRRRRPDRFKF